MGNERVDVSEVVKVLWGVRLAFEVSIPDSVAKHLQTEADKMGVEKEEYLAKILFSYLGDRENEDILLGWNCLKVKGMSLFPQCGFRFDKFKRYFLAYWFHEMMRGPNSIGVSLYEISGVR